MKRFWFLSLFLLSFTSLIHAQDYPENYFRNPLQIPILLAGNFGECRPGHFHSGIDIKTNGKENQPVFAAADGYISRIKMEPGGFGHGLYITHPNGYTTLYAHLNKFMPAIQQYVRAAQYKKENWEVDLQLSPDQFPVKKGQQIAWSGNTGGSTAPHLHFEIRNTKTEHPLNPLLFGIQISDHKSPVPRMLAIYDRASIYSKPHSLFKLQKTGSIYKPENDSITVAVTQAGIGIEVNDFMDESENTLAFYKAEWYVDDALQGRLKLDDIGYDESRYVNAYADFKTKTEKGYWLQCLFQVPGNHLNQIYKSLNANKGFIDLPDSAFHHIKIVFTDARDNNSEVQFSMRQVPATAMDCNDFVTSGQAKDIETNGLKFHLNENDFYDGFCVNYGSVKAPKNLSDSFYINPAAIPIHHYFDLHLMANKPVPFTLRNKIAMVSKEGNEETGKAAMPEEKGWYKSPVRSFGNYRLAIDTTAPIIKPTATVKGNLAKANRIVFTVKDAITSVKLFTATLDGTWILFEQHGNSWFYEVDNHCPRGAHKLVVKAMDENGNTSTQSFTFTR